MRFFLVALAVVFYAVIGVLSYERDQPGTLERYLAQANTWLSAQESPVVFDVQLFEYYLPWVGVVLPAVMLAIGWRLGVLRQRERRSRMETYRQLEEETMAHQTAAQRLEGQLTGREQVIEQLTNDNNDLRQRIATMGDALLMEERLTAADQQAGKLAAGLERAQGELSKQSGALVEVRLREATLKQSLEQEQARVKELKASLEAAMKELATVRTAHHQLEVKIAKLEGTKDSAGESEKIGSLRDKLKEAEVKLAKLEGTLAFIDVKEYRALLERVASGEVLREQLEDRLAVEQEARGQVTSLLCSLSEHLSSLQAASSHVTQAGDSLADLREGVGRIVESLEGLDQQQQRLQETVENLVEGQTTLSDRYNIVDQLEEVKQGLSRLRNGIPHRKRGSRGRGNGQAVGDEGLLR